MNTLPRIKQASISILNIANAARQIAAKQEAGQAQTPLSALFDNLLPESDGQPVRVLILGFAPAAVSSLVKALIGHDYAVFRVAVPAEIGYTEVVLQDRGFSVERGTTRYEFDDIGPFLAALQSQDLLQPGVANEWLDPLRLSLPGQIENRGLTLLLPDLLKALHKRPALFSLLASRADWVLVSAARDHRMDAADIELLSSLFDEVRAWHAVTAPSEEGSAPVGATPFWSELPSTGLLGTIADLPTQKPMLDCFIAADGEGRPLLLMQRRLRRLESALAALSQDLTSATRHTENRIKLQAGGLVADPAADARFRTAAESLRNETQEEFEAIRRSLEEQTRRSLLRGGVILGVIDSIAEEITVEDIEHTEDSDKIKLSLAAPAVERLRIQLLEPCRELLSADLGLIDDTVDSLRERIAATLNRLGGVSVKLVRDDQDAGALWNAVQQVANPEIRYRGEMPKATIGSRFSSARQGIMGIFMMSMILTGFFTMIGKLQEFRNITGAILLPMFIVSFIYTFHAFRKKHAHLLETEVLKVRETVLQELRRVASEVLREKNNQFGVLLQREAKLLLQQCQTALSKIETLARESNEKKRKEAVTHARSAEMRIQALRQQVAEVERLRTDARRVWSELDAGRNELARAAAASPTVFTPPHTS